MQAQMQTHYKYSPVWTENVQLSCKGESALDFQENKHVTGHCYPAVHKRQHYHERKKINDYQRYAVRRKFTREKIFVKVQI